MPLAAGSTHPAASNRTAKMTTTVTSAHFGSASACVRLILVLIGIRRSNKPRRSDTTLCWYQTTCRLDALAAAPYMRESRRQPSLSVASAGLMNCERPLAATGAWLGEPEFVQVLGESSSQINGNTIGPRSLAKRIQTPRPFGRVSHESPIQWLN